MNDTNKQRCLEAMGIVQWQLRTGVAEHGARSAHAQQELVSAGQTEQPAQRAPDVSASTSRTAKQDTMHTASEVSLPETLVAEMPIPERLETGPTPVETRSRKPKSAETLVPTDDQSTHTHNAPFACNLHVIIDNQTGICLIGDVRDATLPAEPKLLEALFVRLGGAGNYTYQGIFRWPISDAFADKKSAEQALLGLLSNWTEQRFLLVAGEISLSLLLPDVTYQLGAVHSWQKAELLVSYDAYSLLMNKSLRHETWSHYALVRQANKP